ncbi:MAG: helix-hairpin-helix domain-containing protein [Candidatus Latescibacterota bacterium]|nr:MAG: helix-hairpin-helix domain-containing protein [Candidatus Latescibacterota bacterium]
MRRFIGVAILFAVAALPRVADLIHTKNADGGGLSEPASDTTLAHPGEPIRAAPRSVSGQAAVPEAYYQNPLQFLSNASVDSLVLLPGIGPVIAERIASARTGKSSFTRWEELLDIKGIGPKKLDRLKRIAGGRD